MSSINNTLPFSDPAEVSFLVNSTSFVVSVNGTQLGAATVNEPFTLYISQNGNTKSITMHSISPNQYSNGNTNNPNTDTVIFNIGCDKVSFRIQHCASQNCFKGIGWDDEVLGQGCTHGRDTYFNLDSAVNFKACLTTVNTSGGPALQLVVKYSTAVVNQQNPGAGLCYQGVYCYSCNNS